jgi:Uma2 family endonuclease
MTEASVRWTTADLILFEGDRANRYEIIDGELLVTRAPDWKHQKTCAKIVTALENWSEQSDLGEVVPAPGVLFSETDHVIPDVVWASYVRLSLLLDEAGHLIGAPELVVEVLSAGRKNEQRDREAKLKLYSVQGVNEYWIVDPTAATVEIYRRDNGRLKLVTTLYNQDEITSPLLPGFSCLVSKFF